MDHRIDVKSFCIVSTFIVVYFKFESRKAHIRLKRLQQAKEKICKNNVHSILTALFADY